MDNILKQLRKLFAQRITWYVIAGLVVLGIIVGSASSLYWLGAKSERYYLAVDRPMGGSQVTSVAIMPMGETNASKISGEVTSMDGTFTGIYAKALSFVPVKGTYSVYGDYILYRFEQSSANPPINVLCSLKFRCKTIVP